MRPISCDGVSEEAKDYIYPRRRRDKNRLCKDIDLGEAGKQRLVCDPYGIFANDFLKPCPLLEKAERELWSMLLNGLRSPSDEVAGVMRRAFGVSPQFARIIRAVPDDLFEANSAALLETEFLSFAPPPSLQRQITAALGCAGTAGCSSVRRADLNRRSADIMLWSIYGQLASSDAFSTMFLRCGLSQPLIEAIAEHGSYAVALAAISLSPMLQLNMRCTEAVVANILLSDGGKELEGLLFLKWKQICSGNEADRDLIRRKLASF